VFEAGSISETIHIPLFAIDIIVEERPMEESRDLLEDNIRTSTGPGLAGQAQPLSTLSSAG
jgi:hypothetical protein